MFMEHVFFSELFEWIQKNSIMGGGVFCVLLLLLINFMWCLLNKSISFIHDILVALHSCIYLSVRGLFKYCRW